MESFNHTLGSWSEGSFIPFQDLLCLLVKLTFQLGTDYSFSGN